MKSGAPKAARYAQRVALAASKPGGVALAGLFEHPVRLNRDKDVLGDYRSRLMMGNAMPFHSSDELLLCELLEMLPFVKAYWTRPQSFKFMLDGKRHIYTPDAVIELATGTSVMIEIVPADRIDDRNADSWSAIDEAINEAGFGFAIATDDIALTETVRSNIAALSQHRHYRLQDAERDCITAALISGPLSVRALRGMLDQNCGACLVEAAIFQRHIFVDLWQPITDDTIVSDTPPEPADFTAKLWSVQFALKVGRS